MVRFITGTKHTPGESDEALLRGAVRAALAAADKVTYMYVYMYQYIYLLTYIYIYIYIYR